MKNKWKQCIILICTITLTSCSEGIINKYDYIDTNTDNATFINKANGTIYFVNRSGKIVDVVDLKLSIEAVQQIQKEKEARDQALLQNQILQGQTALSARNETI